MKKFAFFLPQFHEIPENNKWWGEHFTEWTKVKAARPLFKSHIQPIKPLNDNYYNLLDKETVIWQNDLANKYGVDGFIYYHYYFSGRKLLEKPAENLLKWKEINQKFFFCWANHTWNRSWNGTREVLLEQTYGLQSDWEEHFEYLLPFFKDERYEKKDNKPIFMIFNSEIIEFTDMLSFFDEKCKENGFNGICIIETKRNPIDKEFIYSQTEYVFYREPTIATLIYNNKRKYSFEHIIKKIKHVLAKMKLCKYVVSHNGNKLYDVMCKYNMDNEKIINGVFFGWDNTPRHLYRGSIITAPDKQHFFEYMDKLKEKDYVFINAWNEWAEGMILEPTENNGYMYLEWIKEWSERNSDF